MSAIHADERITELEIKVTYQDELIETLNQCVIEVRNDLDGLQKLVVLLQKQIAESSVSAGPANDPPPHY